MRPPGEGAIYQRKDGQWVASVELTRPGEPRRRKVIYGKSRPEVQRKLGQARRELDAHGDLPTATPTVESWLRTWLDDIAAHEVRQSTLDRTYRPKVERAIAALGRRRLDRLQPEHLRAFYVAMAADGAARSTIEQTHRILSRALKVAVREGKITRNPCSFMDAPKMGRPKVKTRPLPPPALLRLLAEIRGLRLESRWLFALTLGARQGEILGLAWEDIDWDKGTVSIRRALTRVKGQGLRFVDVKSEQSHRALPLPEFLLASLARRRDAWQAEPAGYDPALYGPLAPPSLVWTTPAGGPIDAKDDWEDWTALLKAVGAEHTGTHAARHTVATMLSAQGAPPKVAQNVLGHSQVSLTLNVYTDADVEAIRPWLSALERAFTMRPEIED